MQDNLNKFQDLKSKFENIKGGLNLTLKKAELKKLEVESLDPHLWDDKDKAKAVLQKLSDLKKDIDEIESLEKGILGLSEFVKDEGMVGEVSRELSETEKVLKSLTLKSFLSGEYDSKNALLSIHAGQGGTEAMDWSSMLMRMYLRYAENKGWNTSVIETTPGEEAGIKTVTFKVSGAYSYGYLKGEAGTHRLVRQSPFNADKLRQTSFALVEVLPELDDVDLPDIQIKDEDLDVQFFRSSSQGGQNVQKVSTAVRLTHKPTGIAVTAQSERFQEQNRKNALGLLRAKLWLRSKEEMSATKSSLKGDFRPASWGNQIRSYVLHPYKMVKDLRTGVESSDPDTILAGDLDSFVEEELKLSAV